MHTGSFVQHEQWECKTCLAWVQDEAGILVQRLSIQKVAAAVRGSSQQAAQLVNQQGPAALLHREASLRAQQGQHLHQNDRGQVYLTLSRIQMAIRFEC